MRLSFASAALAAASVLAPVAAGHAPALSQDFSITNKLEPGDPARRDWMRQLQAWWDVHAYYPRHASQNDEGGTVKIHLKINPDGNIWLVDLVESSGSRSLDTAAVAVFSGGFLRPSLAGPTAPQAAMDLSLHYVLAHRHDQPVPADYKPAPSKSPFTISNDPDRSTAFNMMLQRTCTGTVVRDGWRNHPVYGSGTAATAIFFHKSDGTPWVTFTEGGYPIVAPVVEVGKLAQWTGRPEYGRRMEQIRYAHYSVWPDGDNHLTGEVAYPPGYTGYPQGTVDLTCATEVVPAIKWEAWSVTSGQSPPGDPP